ncbi:DUF3667 domain-containing protein [Marixanthomonas ophiurae]|uniref:DUF3667 domain-containing protein n=1 Tax=Marixanthomonas ophiurae TaxID=387659 RepID=A0A3E1QCR2_9FLAO|nr:DUF3667 domain-containing protein [Marixanthomonas ophiurae]RFN59928.1 DUF3667 domain-containing protein [Marixanthomonas ophiurae]
MNCKNCSELLTSKTNYCPECGAKVITHRLTLRSLLSEIYYAFFSIDSNKPVRTFVDLFKKPEEVIGGYIDGVRKKYIHAFGYFTIAVTLSSLFYFILLKFFPETLDGMLLFQNNDAAQMEMGRTIYRSVFEYQTLMFFTFVPVLALLSWIVFFNKRKYNYAEHLIINLYCYSQASIISIGLFFLTFWSQTLFGIISMLSFIIQIVYFAYVLKRLFKLSGLQLLIKFIYFFALLIPLYIIFTIIIMGIMLANGSLDELIEAERAKKEISYTASSAINWTSYKLR